MNILQSWKRSLLVFVPANFMQFLGDVARSTRSVFVCLISKWYLWIVPLIMLLLQNVINQHLIMRFLVKVYPTSEDPNVLLTWAHFLARPVGISVILFYLFHLWLFALIYECAVEVRFGGNARLDIKKHIFTKYAPFMVGISFLWTVLTHGTYAWIIPIFGVNSFIGNAFLFFVLPVCRVVLQLFVYSWIKIESIYFSVLYAHHLMNPALSLWRSFIKTIRDVVYLFPGLLIMGLIIGVIVGLGDILWQGFLSASSQTIFGDSAYVVTLLYYILLPIVINFWVCFYEWQFKRQLDSYID